MSEHNSNKEYEGSEQHFQDLLEAAGRATAYYEDPQTFAEAAHNFSLAWRELLEALGFFNLMDRVNGFLIKLKWRL